MDDTAFVAQEAAQAAATSLLGVPRPGGRPKKQSCKSESGKDRDFWCAGCRNNRVCRLFPTNNVLVAPPPSDVGSSSAPRPAQPVSSTEEDPGRALDVEVAEETYTGETITRWAAVKRTRSKSLNDTTTQPFRANGTYSSTVYILLVKSLSLTRARKQLNERRRAGENEERRPARSRRSERGTRSASPRHGLLLELLAHAPAAPSPTERGAVKKNKRRAAPRTVASRLRPLSYLRSYYPLQDILVPPHSG
jgi:hypothetical protein